MADAPSLTVCVCVSAAFLRHRDPPPFWEVSGLQEQEESQRVHGGGGGEGGFLEQTGRPHSVIS